MADMKARGVFQNPDYSEFTRTAVEVGETLEAKGWVLESEFYSQGVQTFNSRRGKFMVNLIIEEED